METFEEQKGGDYLIQYARNWIFRCYKSYHLAKTQTHDGKRFDGEAVSDFTEILPNIKKLEESSPNTVHLRKCNEIESHDEPAPQGRNY